MGDTVPNKPSGEPSEGGVGKWVRARLKRGGAWLGSLGDPCFLMRHYFWAHLSLVAALAAVGAFLLWALESSLAAGDALLMAVSAVCAVGLTSVGMPALGMPAKGVLLLLAQLASAPLLGLLPSVLRILARRRGRPPVAGERPRGVRVLALLVGVVCCYVALVQL
ncbi:MAG: hypothetical protein Q8P67_10255, partial [archaeon]|nr:hypothetical protein [archaeon]